MWSGELLLYFVTSFKLYPKFRSITVASLFTLSFFALSRQHCEASELGRAKDSMEAMARLNELTALATASSETDAESKRRAAMLRGIWACVWADSEGKVSGLTGMSVKELEDAAGEAQKYDKTKLTKHLNNVWTRSGGFHGPCRQFGEMLLSQSASDSLVIAQNAKTLASTMAQSAAKRVCDHTQHAAKVNPTDWMAQQTERIQSVLEGPSSAEIKALSNILLQTQMAMSRVGGTRGHTFTNLEIQERDDWSRSKASEVNLIIDEPAALCAVILPIRQMSRTEANHLNSTVGNFTNDQFDAAYPMPAPPENASPRMCTMFRQCKVARAEALLNAANTNLAAKAFVANKPQLCDNVTAHVPDK